MVIVTQSRDVMRSEEECWQLLWKDKMRWQAIRRRSARMYCKRNEKQEWNKEHLDVAEAWSSRWEIRKRYMLWNLAITLLTCTPLARSWQRLFYLKLYIYIYTHRMIVHALYIHVMSYIYLIYPLAVWHPIYCILHIFLPHNTLSVPSLGTLHVVLLPFYGILNITHSLTLPFYPYL